MPGINGSSVFMCEYRQTVRKMPVPSEVGVGSSPVRTTRATDEPGEPGGIRLASNATPGGRADAGTVNGGPSRFSGAGDGDADADPRPAGGNGPACWPTGATRVSPAPSASSATTPTATVAASRCRRRRWTRPATAVQRSVGTGVSGTAPTSSRRSSSLLTTDLLPDERQLQLRIGAQCRERTACLDLHRGDRAVEQLGRLGEGEILDVPQDDHRAL